MKKKIICILVALVMCLSIVALTACDNFLIPIENAFKSETEKGESVKPSNPDKELLETPDDSQSGGSTTTPTIFVKGKTFVFDIAAVEYVSMIYPNNQKLMTAYNEDEEETPPLTSEEIIFDIQFIQQYVNEICAEYEGSTLTFKAGNIVEQVFADGTKQTYYYQQSFTNVYIGYLEVVEGSDAANPKYQFVSAIGGQADAEILLLQMELSDYAIAYLQFIVV